MGSAERLWDGPGESLLSNELKPALHNDALDFSAQQTLKRARQLPAHLEADGFNDLR